MFCSPLQVGVLIFLLSVDELEGKDDLRCMARNVISCPMTITIWVVFFGFVFVFFFQLTICNKDFGAHVYSGWHSGRKGVGQRVLYKRGVRAK